MENDAILEMFIFENSQLLEQLEELLLGGEKNAVLNKEQIDETFRVMHTIKGSSAMMGYDNIAILSHAFEDLFSGIREKSPASNEWPRIFDIVLEAIDFLKDQIAEISNTGTPTGEGGAICAELEQIRARLQQEADEPSIDMDFGKAEDNSQASNNQSSDELKFVSGVEPIMSVSEIIKLDEVDDPLKVKYTGETADPTFFKVHIRFDPGCMMETVRCFGVLASIRDLVVGVRHVPENIDTNKDDEIIQNGFLIYIETAPDSEAALRDRLEQTMFLNMLEITPIGDDEFWDASSEMVVIHAAPTQETSSGEKVQDEPIDPLQPSTDQAPATKQAKQEAAEAEGKVLHQSFISVNVNKIDKLMNLVGEIVTTESMVTKNPDLDGLELENFNKQARLLRKLTDELQDIVMSVRMVSIASTFQKMQRIVRDMSKKIAKDADLIILGEDTEVDKNIIDSLSDPLMHLIRNAMDHGLETAEERERVGKPPRGRITLEAKNTGGDVIVRVSDDGKGLNRELLIRKAIEKGLTMKNESEISDKEAFSFVLMPGFSTKDQVTEFSGRGVGMDVVRNNIENVGGTVSVESVFGEGTTIVMHIPLTLAILDGMKVSVGRNMYIIPTPTIKESLEPRLYDIIIDPSGEEIIMIRGLCYPIIRLHEAFGVEQSTRDFNDGIMVFVENENKAACLFADKLLGEQQAVVKPMPAYITKTTGRTRGVAGCSIMGDGSIALILDVNSLLA